MTKPIKPSKPVRGKRKQRMPKAEAFIPLFHPGAIRCPRNTAVTHSDIALGFNPIETIWE